MCNISIVFFCVLCSTSAWDITSGVVYMAFQKMRMKYFLERPPSVKIWNFLYSYALEIWFSHLKWILGSSSFMNIKYMTIFRFFHFSLEIFVFELHLSIRDQDWQFLREALLKYSSSWTKKLFDQWKMGIKIKSTLLQTFWKIGSNVSLHPPQISKLLLKCVHISTM